MAINIWRRFEKLVKPAAEEVATVTAVHADGTITAESLTGGTLRLRCAIDVAVGGKVFTAGGAVLAKAPNLVYHEIAV
ncbi:MAG: hypothetical protein CSB24_04640 [Deltaproteobacteria bacterium]|nr:MAG: hypothetical protein CSB24_04640 [Deltaproteobacteria bacterium]